MEDDFEAIKTTYSVTVPLDNMNRCICIQPSNYGFGAFSPSRMHQSHRNNGLMPMHAELCTKRAGSSLWS